MDSVLEMAPLQRHRLQEPGLLDRLGLGSGVDSATQDSLLVAFACEQQQLLSAFAVSETSPSGELDPQHPPSDWHPIAAHRIGHETIEKISKMERNFWNTVNISGTSNSPIMLTGKRNFSIQTGEA